MARTTELLRGVARRARWPAVYAILCAALILSLRARAWQHLATLNMDEWAPVEQFVRSNRNRDEPVCFLPSWTKGHAIDLRKFRNIDLIESPQDAWEGREEPLSGFWVVSQFGAFDPSTVPRSRYRHRAQRNLGGADVHLFRNEPITLPDSFAFHVPEATCTLRRPDRTPTAFTWYRTGLALPRSDRQRDELSYMGCRLVADRFSGMQHFGIWLHPPPAGSDLTMTFADVEVEPWLLVSGGLRDQVASNRASDVTLLVAVGDQRLATLRFPPRRGWTTYALATKTHGGRQRVAFKVSATNNHSRHFVLDAKMSRSRPAEARDPDDPPDEEPGRQGRGRSRRPAESLSQPPDLAGERDEGVSRQLEIAD